MIKIHKKPSLQLSDEYLDFMLDFAKFVTTKLPFQNDINIFLVKRGEKEGCSTGLYQRNDDTIWAVAEGRALVDILKTIAHEMVHKKQEDKGQIGDNYTAIGGFAEDEANVKAGNFIKMYVQEKNLKKLYEL